MSVAVRPHAWRSDTHDNVAVCVWQGRENDENEQEGRHGAHHGARQVPPLELGHTAPVLGHDAGGYAMPGMVTRGVTLLCTPTLTRAHGTAVAGGCDPGGAREGTQGHPKLDISVDVVHPPRSARSWGSQGHGRVCISARSCRAQSQPRVCEPRDRVRPTRCRWLPIAPIADACARGCGAKLQDVAGGGTFGE